ncbi:hypothetical protein [Fluviispira multicolorata]|uniref:N-acetyltransferase domain-containing protein n=1 Tax=Fluviispira multicolorata TaxID=2654512 RepID=A0A833JFR6_9BACT|nr:hypothetical protein [Fluviispira multicolorata]KAB8033558.1 hypothetical protein GCL57_02295 [Fluviispira multicolorata]
MQIYTENEMRNEHLKIWKEFFSSGILNKYQIERVEHSVYIDMYTSEMSIHNHSELRFIKEHLLSSEEKRKKENLANYFKNHAIRDSLLVKDNGKIIAMFHGEQKESDEYLMKHALVHKDYRKIGIYSDYLSKTLDYTQKMGFLKIVSSHTPTNNDIIILKLQKEFYISSMEIHPELGMNVNLIYFNNEEIKKAFYFRCGIIEFSKKLFKNSLGTAQNLLNKLEEESLD